MIRWCDRVVTGGLGFLILFTPLAFGSVHPWAFALMEVVIFSLVIVATVRSLLGVSRLTPDALPSSSSPFALSALPFAQKLSVPLFLFFGFVGFQLLPLPPGLIRIISPATYEVHTHSLLGWPEGQEQSAKGKSQNATSQPSEVGGQRSENAESVGLTPDASPLTPHSSPETPVILPTPGEVESGAPVPFEKQRSDVGGQASAGEDQRAEEQKSEIRDQTSENGAQNATRRESLSVSGKGSAPDASRLTPDVSSGQWFPLSLAPSRTRSDLLKLLSYAAIFFLVLLYPFEQRREQGSGGRGQPEESRGRRIVRNLMSFRLKRQSSEYRAESRGQRARSSGPRSAVGGQSRFTNGQWSAGGHAIRLLLVLVTVSGLIVAVVGFIQLFTWNGKILWFFIPYDWGTATLPEHIRASGPFINPDHFANYLALILPLALGLVLSSRKLLREESQLGAKIFFSLVVFVAFTSLLLSLSRSGWMSAVLGTALLFWMLPRSGTDESPSSKRSKKKLVTRVALAASAIFLIVSLLLIGPAGREQVDSRLHETVTQETGLAGRVGLWRDTVQMMRDFPVLGVGLGAWQDLFPRYQSPPWMPVFVREAHNDYVELLAETGFVGFVLLVSFFFIAGRGILSHFRMSPESNASKGVAAMLVAALAAMTFHEFFDFNLQIPANAFLFTLLLAIALRVAVAGSQSAVVRGPSSVIRFPWSVLNGKWSAVGAIALSVLLIVSALRQEMVPYPYSLKVPDTVAEANEMILAHPALSTPHVYLVRLAEDKAPVEWQLNQIEVALWLNPNDPYIRDQYARLLFAAGHQTEALSQVTQSIFRAPLSAAHYYLNARLLPWLSSQERDAVESGFKQASALAYPESMENLAAFYGATERFAHQAKLYEAAAVRETEANASADLFIKAADGYLKAGDVSSAEILLRKASTRAPKDPRPYQMLASMIYGPRKETAGISKTISEGLKSGAPAFDLYLSLAEATQKAGALDETKKALSMAKEALHTQSQEEGQEPLRPYYTLAETAQRLGFPEEAKDALLHVLELRSSSTETLIRLANLYFQENNFNRAAYYFRSYVEINPAAADAFYHLALAEERQYRFVAAEAAYRRAMELAPQHDAYRQGYEALKLKVAQNKKPDA